MASEEKNALAELAERMFEEVDGQVLTNPNREDFCKAQRIIAELAKVEVIKGSDLVCNPGQAVGAVERCRAIAEEGAKE